MREKNRIMWLLGFLCGLSLVINPNLSVWAAQQVVVCGWGGTAAQGMKECFFDPFEKETGIKVIMTSPPDVGKIKAQVDSGNIEWDLVITDIPAILILTEGGAPYLEALDYSKLDRNILAQLVPESQGKYYVGLYTYSFNICYNTKSFSKGNHPKSWADVWDVKKFPGVRSFNNPYGGIVPQYEIWLMADGVPPNELYPIDVERAWKSIAKLKPYISKWYKSHAEAVQMLLNGEVDIAATMCGRVIAEKWKGAPVAVEYNQGKMATDNYCIIKGAKNKEEAYKLINFCLDAKREACFSSKLPYGYSNREASKYIDPKIADDLNTSPVNLPKQVWENVKWWSEKGPDGKTNRERAIERFNKFLLQ